MSLPRLCVSSSQIVPVERSTTGQGLPTVFVAVVGDDLQRRPRLAAVGRALQHQVDVAGVAAALLAALAEGEQRALRRDDQRRDAEGVVALGAADEEVVLRRRRGRREGEEQRVHGDDLANRIE